MWESNHKVVTECFTLFIQNQRIGKMTDFQVYLRKIKKKKSASLYFTPNIFLLKFLCFRSYGDLFWLLLWSV